jgi:hypothetical protein
MVMCTYVPGTARTIKRRITVYANPSKKRDPVSKIPNTKKGWWKPGVGGSPVILAT